VIVNKVHYGWEGGDESLVRELTHVLGDPDLALRVGENFHDYQALAARDAENIARLVREMRARRVIRVPYLDEDVHDLAGLAAINRYLFATESEREALAAGVA
jgi:hypothetical protein